MRYVDRTYVGGLLQAHRDGMSRRVDLGRRQQTLGLHGHDVELDDRIGDVVLDTSRRKRQHRRQKHSIYSFHPLILLFVPQMHHHTDIYIGDVEFKSQTRLGASSGMLARLVALVDLVVVKTAQSERYGGAHIGKDIYRHAGVEVELEARIAAVRILLLVAVHVGECHRSRPCHKLPLCEESDAPLLVEPHVGAVEYRPRVARTAHRHAVH